MQRTASIENFPAINQKEFEEASKALIELAVGRLQGSNWLSIESKHEGLQIRQQRRPLNAPTKFEDDIAEADVIEEDEETVIREPNTGGDTEIATFSILVSPTYQVPVLWFALSDHKPIDVGDIDQMYVEMVTPQAQSAMKQIGVLGAISIGYHPATDIPMFFIHPCETQQALRAVCSGVDLTPLEYLMLWFGIIGSSVGLSIPVQVVAASDEGTS